MTDLATMIARAIADALESARQEHRRTFPHENYKAANIAMGGLRTVASAAFPETFGMGNEQAIAALRARPSLEPAPLTVADALAVPEVRALVDAAKAYALENDCYDEENSIAMNAWRSARSKLAAALRGIGGAE